MSNQLEKVKELIELRAKARLGGGVNCVPKPAWEVEKKPSRNNTQKGNIQHANASPCYLTKAVLKKWICL